MLVDLAEKLRPLGNLGLLDSIGTKALAQLESRPEAQMRAGDLVNRSRALRTVGEVMLGEGRLDEAESAFTRAVEAARSAIAAAPDAAEAQAEMGIAAYWLGLHHYRQRRFEQARTHWTTYLRTSEALVALQPDRMDWRIELSYALNNLGAVARDQGRMVEAQAYFRRSARIKSEVLSTRPDDDALRYDLVDTLSWISSVDESEGRLREAAAGYSEQIGMLRRLVASKPDALLWQRRLATSLLSSGALAASRGLLDDAKAQIDEAIALLSKLTAREPGNKGWAHDLVLAHVEACELAWMRGEHDDHRAHARIAGGLIHDIESSSESTPAVRRLKAALQLLVASHPVNDATDAGWSAAIAMFEDNAARSKHDLQETSALAKALVARGRHHADAGRPEAARRDWQRAIALLAVPARTSRDPNVIAPWASAHLLLGERHRVQARIAWLAEIGYRDAQFPVLQGQAHAGGIATHGPANPQ
jgi:tetratricopeptide (TPR) repeat protein